MTKVLRILGIRGVPAAHGGFETFAENLAIYLCSRGWRVVVYCQEEGSGPAYIDHWNGVERIHIPVDRSGPLSTVVFDWRAVAHAAKHKDLCLTLGYNTAMFCALLRLKGVKNLINMDGVEWRRAKWSGTAKIWFWLNDWIGCWLGNHLIADHPEIKRHLATRVDADKITTIAYGAARVDGCSAEAVERLGLRVGEYFTVVARPEPENSLIEIVSGFSRKRRGFKLVVLGNYESSNSYHASVKAAASDEVLFPGAIYDKAVVSSLRFHSRAYIHGHQVGGTNPSLVEAMGAGNAVIAHDNKFNRWVVGDTALFFDNESSIANIFDLVAGANGKVAVEAMSLGIKSRFESEFTWQKILTAYEELLLRYTG